MRARVAQAYATRAGVIGLLQCCRCLYPLVHSETETGHDEACPAHAMTLSARAGAGSVAGWYQVSLDIDTPPAIVEAADRFARGRQ